MPPTTPGAGNRDRVRGPRKGSRPGLREGQVVESTSPTIEGQQLRVVDPDGEVWTVDCLGEPVPAGARVAFEVRPPEEARRGDMIRLVDASRSEWVCRVRRSGGSLELIPFSGAVVPKLSLAPADAKGAADGDRVRVVHREEGGKKSRGKKGARPRRRSRSEGLPVRVREVFGPAGDPSADFLALVWKHRLPGPFSRRARLEAEEVDDTLSREVIRRRLDLRHLPFITIDPATARDHDDAVFAERAKPTPELRVAGSREGAANAAAVVSRSGRWDRRLWVAIADVSHFVPEGGWIDAEARRRGNSFYFPDRSIPMLPERLSSDLCSLRPGVDRLAMVAELRLDAQGTVVDALFHEALIRSAAGLAYEEAADWLLADALGEADETVVWADSMRVLDSVATDLQAARERAGALTLELPEVGLVMNDEGRPVDAAVRSRNRAHVLIEEAMLATNRVVARALDAAERPTLHRDHPPPPPQKWAELESLFESFGLAVDGPLDEPGVLARALESARGMPSHERLSVAVLRSMSQARYAPASGGHYALRFDHYLHFTSPIRRYADLEVHRALRRMIRGVPSPRSDAFDARLSGLSVWLSGRERVAQEAERDAQAFGACALMADRIGERFEAAVTRVTEYGLFIRLVAPAVEGLIPMRALNGYWVLAEGGDALVAEGSGARIELGASLSVRLLSVDPDRGRLAFRPERERGSVPS